MILAALAALVIHAYDGTDKVISDIEPAACEASRCMVLWKQSCGKVVAEGVKAEMGRRKENADQVAWERANPKAQAHCLVQHTDSLYCGPVYGIWGRTFGTVTAYGGVSAISGAATQSAMCIPQRGDR